VVTNKRKNKGTVASSVYFSQLYGPPQPVTMVVYIRGLILAMVRCMTVQVIKFVLQPELILIGQNLLYRSWAKRGIVYVLYIYELSIYHAIICKLIRKKSNAQGYNWVTLFLEEIYTGTWPSWLGESQK
jgi:hypothetical protein